VTHSQINSAVVLPALPHVFHVSPLVRLALWSLYLALLLPLPFLAQRTAAFTQISAEMSTVGIITAIVAGGMVLHMVLSEEVRLDEEGIAVCYPWWVPTVLRRGWSLCWSEISALKTRPTGQGGLVYYLVARERGGFLLPMRVVGFTQMMRLIQAKTGIDTQDVKLLAQPWMYATLLATAGLLALTDGWLLWTIFTAPAMDIF
jgi:hypothetical protein